jgi:mannose-6-phosphate isomerase-like protein (cupin superfamily)
MPVIRGTDEAPTWLRWSGFGIGQVDDPAAFDRHFHDADEFWFVIEGRARVLSEGVEYTVGPGDILATRMGDEHDVLEIMEAPFRCFWVEDELRGRRRPGHLHRGVDDPGDPSALG